jgi:hypothetical protein
MHNSTQQTATCFVNEKQQLKRSNAKIAGPVLRPALRPLVRRPASTPVCDGFP